MIKTWSRRRSYRTSPTLGRRPHRRRAPRRRPPRLADARRHPRAPRPSSTVTSTGPTGSSPTTTPSTRSATRSRTSASASSAFRACPPRPALRRGALRVAHELERSADLMVNVARIDLAALPAPARRHRRPLVDRLGRQAGVQLRVAVNAFADRDPSWAAALSDMDDTIDELEKRLFRHVLEDDGGGHRRQGPQRRGAAGAGRPPLRADRRPRGDHRPAGALRGHRRAQPPAEVPAVIEPHRCGPAP